MMKYRHGLKKRAAALNQSDEPVEIIVGERSDLAVPEVVEAVRTEGRQRRKDDFEDRNAELLDTVSDVLEEILLDEDAPRKDKLHAAKMVLDVAGLVGKRNSADEQSVHALLAALRERHPVDVPSQVIDSQKGD